MKNLKIIIALLVFISLFSCGKDPICFDDFQFKIPINIYAKSDTISIGDTVSVDIAFPTILINLINGDKLAVPAKYFVHSISINKITDDSNSLYIDAYYSTGGYNCFNIIPITGSISTAGGYNFFGDLNYINQNDSVYGKFSYIANDTGTFVFTMVDFLFVQLNSNSTNEDLGLNPTNDCKDQWRNTLFENQKPNNYYIIKQRGVYVDSTKFQYPKSVIDKQYNLKYGSFSVVVK